MTSESITHISQVREVDSSLSIGCILSVSFGCYLARHEMNRIAALRAVAQKGLHKKSAADIQDRTVATLGGLETWKGIMRKVVSPSGRRTERDGPYKVTMRGRRVNAKGHSFK